MATDEFTGSLNVTLIVLGPTISALIGAGGTPPSATRYATLFVTGFPFTELPLAKYGSRGLSTTAPERSRFRLPVTTIPPSTKINLCTLLVS